MSLVENTSIETRVWPALKTAEGTTLELEPGQTTEVELPADFSDPYLQVKAAKPKPEAAKGSAPSSTAKEQS